MSQDQINALAARAGQAANAGQFDVAERLWGEVRKLQPNHPQALYSLGVHAFQRGDAKGALGYLQAAHDASPSDPMILLTSAVILRETGDSEGEWRALNTALAADPYFLPGLLSKGAWFERKKKPHSAAETYRNALKVAPPPEAWPPALKAQLTHAAKIVDAHSIEYAAYLEKVLGVPSARLQGETAGRWREAASIMAKRSVPYLSGCNQLYIPRLPAIPFFERERFSWVPALEAKTAAIREELKAALAAQSGKFVPYIAYGAGEPVNQWDKLNNSLDWSTLHLWKSGTRDEDNLALVPETAAALDEVELADIGGLCPNAMFSALAPKTEIPPHQGETNARVIVHLPLIVPPDCSYRVGFEKRTWEEGRCLIFDDTLEHTARNDSSALRVVLIFDVWNPLISNEERDMVRAMTAAARAFHAE